MKSYRHYNGQFITKAEHERRILRRFYTYAPLFALCVCIGIIAETSTVEYIAPKAEAHGPTMMEQEDLCSLLSVECTDEKPVTIAVDAISEALGHRVTDETVRRVTYLYEKTSEAGVPFYDAVKTIWCESMWISQKSHLPEESYGIAQVHVPSHQISPETALDAYWSIDFLVEHWFTAQAVADNMWYGYSRATGLCTNGLTINL